MDFDLLFPGRFIKAADLQGRDVTLTIDKVVLEEITGEKVEIKGIVTFAGKTKQWVLNKTNGLCLKQMFGRETNEWIGKRVTLFPTTYDGDPCIRVRGSPDIEDMVFDLKLPKKKPKATKLLKTRTNGRAPATSPPASAELSDEDKAAILARERAEAFAENEI